MARALKWALWPNLLLLGRWPSSPDGADDGDANEGRLLNTLGAPGNSAAQGVPRAFLLSLCLHLPWPLSLFTPTSDYDENSLLQNSWPTSGFVVVQLPSDVRLFAAWWTVESFDSKLNFCSTISEISLHRVEGEIFWLPPITCPVVYNLGKLLGGALKFPLGPLWGQDAK